MSGETKCLGNINGYKKGGNFNGMVYAPHGLAPCIPTMSGGASNPTLMEKIQAKEQAKQDAEKAELDKQTAIAQAETEKVIAETEAQVSIIKANAEAEMKLIAANAEAEANRAVSSSITQQLIDMKIAEARMEHGWVEITGSGVMVSK